MQKTLLLSVILFTVLYGENCIGQEGASKVGNMLILPSYSEIKMIKRGNKLQTDTPLTNQVRKKKSLIK